MTRKLSTPCTFSGCPAIAVKDGRCEQHKRKPWAGQKRHAGGRAWQRTRARIFARDGGLCVYCGATAEVVDHVLCRAHGGSDDDSNLVACCKACNQRKMQREARGGDVLMDSRVDFLGRRSRREVDGRRVARLCINCISFED